MATPNPSHMIQISLSKPSTNSGHGHHGWTNEAEADFRNLIDYIRANSELYFKKARRRSLFHKLFVGMSTVSSIVGAVCASSSSSVSEPVIITSSLLSASLVLINSTVNFVKQQIVFSQMAEGLDNLARKIQTEMYKPPSNRANPLTFALEVESVETKIMKRESELML